MYIPEEKIAQILNASDIVDVVSQHVILKKSGSNYFGLCPFHSEKTPSFSVNTHKQIFYCFGCGAGGDALNFLKRYHGITFPEAAKMMARKYNITVETKEIDPARRKQIQRKESLFRLNKSIMGYYEAQLKDSQQGKSASGYLSARKTSPDIIREFHLGFAPDAWDGVVTKIREKKISRSVAVQSGLVLERKQSSGCYDRFRNRIMFPIFDINMQVAGFGGRVMDDAMPKYMNSPETPVYSKSRILYGLHASKQFCRQQGSVYIVEGYFDFLSLYQHGIKNCVASLGTALTHEHVRILKGYAPKMILVFDSDAAGINAAKRSIKVFVKEGVDMRILVLPDGHDPDSYVMKHGKEAFDRLASKAGTVMQFLLQLAIDTHGNSSVEGRMNILNEMKPHLIDIQDSALRSLHIKQLAETINIDEKAVLEKVREHRRHHRQAPSAGLFEEAVPENQPLESDPREKQLISMILNYPKIIDTIKKTNVLTYFYSEKLKSIGEEIICMDPNTKAFVSSVMAKIENNEDQQLLASLSVDDDFSKTDITATATALINRIIKVRKRKDNTLTHKIITAEKLCDADVLALLKEKQAEIQQLQ